jgi:hypothetical protein
MLTHKVRAASGLQIAQRMAQAALRVNLACHVNMTSVSAMSAARSHGDAESNSNR